MQAKMDDLDRLLEAQALDLQIINLNKQLEELPQPARIAQARAKQQALAKKADQIQALKKDAAKRMLRVSDEDASLEKKQNGVQAAIDSAQGDFRNVEARTKELAGIAKRRETIADERAGIQAELDKIGALETQVATAMVEMQRVAQDAAAEHEEQAGSIGAQVADLTRKRDGIFAQVDGDLVGEYRKVSKRLGSIAIGELEDNRCGVCRSTIEGGRLIDVRSQAPLGTCPSCKRLLIIRAE